MKRILRYFTLMFLIVVSIHKPVFANPTAEQRQNERFEIEQKIESLDMEIEEVIDKIKNNKTRMVKIQEDIKLAEKELNKAEEDIKIEQELYNERMRVMYMNGSAGYLDVILGAESLSDLFQKVEAVKKITELDKKIVKELKEKQQSLNNKKEELNKQNNSLVVLNNENDKKLNKLKTDKKEQSKLIEEAERQDRLYAASREIAERQERLYASSIELAPSEINKVLKEVKSNKSITKENRLSRGTTSVSGEAVVAYASKFLGTPYLWGGTTPDGFDCSGFTQYVYKQFGIYVGRTTKNQIHDGIQVARDQLEIGDLVFYGKGGIPSHMGIYIGEGMYIHAPRTGDVVKISSYNRKDYITARRVIR